jgi:hypothetical protein
VNDSGLNLLTRSISHREVVWPRGTKRSIKEDQRSVNTWHYWTPCYYSGVHHPPAAAGTSCLTFFPRRKPVLITFDVKSQHWTLFLNISFISLSLSSTMQTLTRQSPSLIFRAIRQTSSTDSTVDVTVDEKRSTTMSPPPRDMPSSPKAQPRMMAFPSIFRSTAAPEAIDDNGQDCFWSLQRCDAFDEDDDDLY